MTDCDDLRAALEALAAEFRPMVDQGSGSYLNPRTVVAKLDALLALATSETARECRSTTLPPCAKPTDDCRACATVQADRDAGQVRLTKDETSEVWLALPDVTDAEARRVFAAVESILAARQSAPDATERVEWGVQKRCYPLGTGYRIYGDDEQGARDAAPKVIGSGAYVIRRTIRTTVTTGEWTEVD